jgi:hypothetical protein
MDPENAKAYAAKLLAELRVKRHQDLPNCAEPFDNRPNYQKAVRYADEELAAMLKGYIAHIKTRNEANRLDATYKKAIKAMDEAHTEADFLAAAGIFESISHYLDAAEKVVICRQKAAEFKELQKEASYVKAVNAMNSAISEIDDNNVASMFAALCGYKDSEEKRNYCLKRARKRADFVIAHPEILKKETMVMKLAAAKETLAVEKKKYTRMLRTLPAMLLAGLLPSLILDSHFSVPQCILLALFIGACGIMPFVKKRKATMVVEETEASLKQIEDLILQLREIK